jgi:hypothetical protein
MILVRSWVSARSGRADNPDKVEVGKPLSARRGWDLGDSRAPDPGRDGPPSLRQSCRVLPSSIPLPLEGSSTPARGFRPRLRPDCRRGCFGRSRRLRTRIMSDRSGRVDNPDTLNEAQGAPVLAFPRLGGSPARTTLEPGATRDRLLACLASRRLEHSFPRRPASVCGDTSGSEPLSPPARFGDFGVLAVQASGSARQPGTPSSAPLTPCQWRSGSNGPAPRPAGPGRRSGRARRRDHDRSPGPDRRGGRC